MRITSSFFAIFGFMVSITVTMNAWSMGRPFQAAASNDILAGWPAANAIDGNANTAYSSNSFATANNNRGTYLVVWTTSPQKMSQIILNARMYNGVPQGFPVTYDIKITSSDDSVWMDLGQYSVQPDQNGDAVVNLPSEVVTWGALITPVTLGVDIYGTHYFQMAGVTWNDGTIANNIFSQNVTNFVNTYNNSVQPDNVGGMLYGEANASLPAINSPAPGQNPPSLPPGHWTTANGGAGFTLNTNSSLWSSSDVLVDINPQYYYSAQPYPFRGPSHGLQFSMDMSLLYLWMNNTKTGGTSHGLVYFWFQDNTTGQAFWLGANIFDVRGKQPSPYYKQFDNGTSDPNLYQDLSYRGNEYLTPLPGSALISYAANATSTFYGFTVTTSQFSNAINDVNALVAQHPAYGKKAYSADPSQYSLIGLVFNNEINRVNGNNAIQGVISLELHNTTLNLLQ